MDRRSSLKHLQAIAKCCTSMPIWISQASYFGESAGTMKPGDSHEILFELMPRKFSVEATAAENIIAEIRAIWKFIERTRNHASASRMLEFLNDDVAS